MTADSNSAFDIANNSTLTTNLNVAPYYDDYDSANEYYRILYKPGYAVQARELTQMQTMLQKQIDRFGKHVFNEGSIVLPGAFTLEAGHCEANGQICTGDSVAYVRVSDYDNTNTAVNITYFSGQIISGTSNYIKAQVMDVVDGDQTTANSKTLFVRYVTGSNANTSITTFQPGEVLSSNAGTLVVLADGYVANTTSTGLGARFEIERGVFFAKENFIAFPKQSIILDSYNHIPSCKVGFLINEEITSSITDASLLDPALEASNYAAPGADRLKLSTALHVTSYDDPVGPPDFVTLFTIKEGVLQAEYDRPQYNILQDEMAKRTYDESGDYYVTGTAVQIREHDDTGSNYGKYANGNNSLLFVGVDAGTLFVKGYEIGILDTVELSTEKSLTYNNVNSQLSSTTLGSYVLVNELTGTWPLDVGNSIDLYDTAQTRLTSLRWSSAGQTGKKIGAAALASLEYASGTEGYDANYYVYLSDIRMLGSNTFANVKSLYINNASVSDAGADIILTSDTATLLGVNDSAPIYYVGSDFTRNIKTAADPTLSDTTFSFNRTEGVSVPISIVSAGTVSVSIAPGDEIFPYGTTTLSASDKRDIRLSLDSSFNIALSGTVVANAGNGGTTTLTGTTTNFTRLNVGDKIEFSGKGNTLYIASITSDTVLTTTLNIPAGINGNTAYKAYKAGDMIDLTGKGVDAGTTRTVNATPTLLSFDLKETLGDTKSATITYQLARTSAKEVQKLLRTSRFVSINCSLAGTTGPYDLGFSDIYRIRAITKKSSAPTYSGDGTDVLNDFNIDRGQKDTHYDHGTITPKSALSASDYLLVELDYFAPNFTSRAGYFSVDSYPVEDNDEVFDSSTNIRTENIPVYKSPVSGKEYDLRNHLDFRPTKTITASDTTNANTATSNPAVSTTFNYSTGIRFPVPSTELMYDYSYYLARKDLVVVNKDKQFNIIKGIPAVVPITPLGTDNNMSLAVLEIPPYPSLSPAYAKGIGRPNLASRSRRASSVRFTMKDIGVLKDRIVNLEYYASLSLLEKQATDMKILDENGVDRFKNGIFVDTFRDHLLGATYNPDYRITVDPVEKSIRPLYTMEAFGYDYVSGTNVVKSNDIITLAYTEVSTISQNAATSVRNIERSSYRFFGNMTLVPDQDVWVDTTFEPDEKITIGPTLEDIGQLGVTPSSGSGAYALVGSDVNLPGGELPLTTTWGAWKQLVTGYNVYSGSGDSKVFDGTYATRDAAQSAANKYTNNSDATIETLYDNVRTGTEQFLTDITDSATLGYKVTDTSIIPYIRSQTIAIFVRGLKPHTLMHFFFDNEPSDNYCSPITADQYENYIQHQPFITAIAFQEGSDLVTNEDGTLYLLFRIDESKKYRVGSKSLILSDSPTNADDATTGARAFFNAQGLNVSKQNTILTTRDVIPLQKEVQESYVSNAFETVPRIVPAGGGGGGGCKSCLAYSILAKAPGGEEGIYLTSVDIYISAKSSTRGIWFEMREMDNAGGITRNALPLSEVWYNSEDVPISADGKTNPLKVTFQAPIFLYNNVQYAFVIHTEAIDPDYYLWVSHLGETDVNLNTAVNSRGMHGTLFTTNNNLNWDIVPDVDLTCIFRRAEFDSTLTGTATLGDKPVEKTVLANVSTALSARIGDRFISGDTITIASSNGTILVSDVLRGNVSAFNASVVTAVSNTEYATTETGFSIGEKIDAYYSANGLYKGVSATVTAVANAFATLSKYSETSFVTQASFINSNGKFKANDIIKSVIAGNTYSAQIVSIDNYRYSVASFEPSFVRPNLTDILFEMKSYSNTGTAGAFISVNPSTENYFNTEQALYSRSREISDLSSTNSNQIRVTMTTLSNAVSPLLDLARTQNIYIDNLINSNTTNETASSGGEMFNKYISRTITLADGQDAEDINVMLTSYRPPGTDVKVYVKILHSEDAEGFAAKSWTELEKTEATSPLYSSLTDRNDFKEFTYNFPDAIKTGTNGEVQYTNGAGAVFTGYKYFAVKIGLLDDSNTAVVPRVADLRCVALQI